MILDSWKREIQNRRNVVQGRYLRVKYTILYFKGVLAN